MNAIVSATVIVCTCLTSLSYSIVVFFFLRSNSVHSVVVQAKDFGTHVHVCVHLCECVYTVVQHPLMVYDWP